MTLQNYIQDVINAKGHEISPEALNMANNLVNGYIEKLTREALLIAQYHHTLSTKKVNKIYSEDIDLILKNKWYIFGDDEDD